MLFSFRSALLLPVLVALAAAISSLSPVLGSELGTDWKARWPSPTNNDLFDLAANGSGNLVVVGAHGTVLSTNDLSAWTRVNTGVTDDFVGVTWANSAYYAVSVKGTILGSSNSTTWSARYTSTTDIFQCVAWTGSQVVAAGAYVNGSVYSAVVVTSADGVNWTRRTFPNMGPITRMAWNGQLLVGIMNEATASSIDGSSWSVHPLPNGATAGSAGTKSIVWTGGVFFVSGDAFWSSTDGVVWAEFKNNLTNVAGSSISWTGSELILTKGNSLLTSVDGQNFTDRSSGLPAPETYGVRYVASNVSYIVMAGAGGHVDAFNIDATGSPGPTWSTRNSAALITGVRGIAAGMDRSTPPKPLYVAVGAGIAWTSPDGLNWTEKALSNSFDSVTWTGVQFVACGSGIWTSPDGVTWTQAVAADANGKQVWTMVAWVNGKAYASGVDNSTGHALSSTSPDGTTWTTSNMAGAVFSIATNADYSLYIAVGLSGTALLSTDHGATWQGGSVPLGGGQDFEDVTFGNGQFVAVTSGGSIWKTTNGTSWGRVLIGSGSLNSIAYTTYEYVAVGGAGRVLRSFDGLYWRPSDAATSSALNVVMYDPTGPRLIGAGASSNFVSSDGTVPVKPTVQFTSTSSSMTEGGSVGLVLTLSQSWTIPVQLTLSYTGTATSADYTAPGTTVMFQPGETSEYIILSAADNNVINNGSSGKTIILTLTSPTGDALVGTANTHTVTILDNDVAPTFDLSPLDQLAAPGGSVTFVAHAAGSGTMAYQWKKNGAVIPNAKASSYTIAKVGVGDAAAYSVTATNNTVTSTGAATIATSAIAHLGVVTVQNYVQEVKAASNAAFTATATAPGAVLHYQWRRGTLALVDAGHLAGTTTSKLTITSVLGTDSNTYTCDVTLGSGMAAPTMTATTVGYTVVGAVPAITAPDPINTRVAASVDFTPAATNQPTKWAATNLPPGITFNTMTGRLMGKLTTSNTYAVKLTATNLMGPSAQATLAITVAPLPAVTQGMFVALLDRSSTMNANLGGRVDLTTAANGSFTGKLTMPLTPVAFTGVLTGASNANFTSTVAVTVALSLTITIDQGTGALSVTVANGVNSVAGTGLVKAVAGASRTGAYNFALDPDSGSPAGHPAGDGYGQFTVAATGLLTASGRLADGQAFTCSSFTGTDGSIPLFSLANAAKGSLIGLIKINENGGPTYATNFITGTPTWYKGAEAASYSYTAGIPVMTLNADGGRYAPPAGSAIVMNLLPGTGNAVLTFSGAGLDSATLHPSGAFSVAAPAKVTAPASNNTLTSLAFTVAGGVLNGLFTGQFTLADIDTTVTPHKSISRTVLYTGLSIRPAGSDVMVGRGFFNLPQMPATSAQTVATSPVLSGLVTLTRP